MLQRERRHPWRRLTTSHSKIIGRPRRLSLPQLVLPHGGKEIERTDFPSDAKCRDVEPPTFEYTQRSKEGAKNDAPPNEQRPLGRRLGKASRSGVFCAPTWDRRLSGADPQTHSAPTKDRTKAPSPHAYRVIGPPPPTSRE